jgi:energy-coupling factor transport system substrate-specific component
LTWQAVTFAGLVLVLAGGFWWYERSRPSARLVALVAALAALAVAGRLVFAPVPNLVATTDIALLTGYSLGAGPGFAVGALAAPISNIWLGQGPWTAWQMAGWGLVGLGGAWLAVVSHRRFGRLGLALGCAAAGFLYGALLDLSVMVTYGGEQSLDRYLALSARGLPFNVVHALGNFAIAFAAGPALVRMISRFRTRLEFTWRPAGAVPLAVALLGLVVVVSALPQRAESRASGLSWLERAQSGDGGFAAVEGQSSSPAMTGWAILGLEAAGVHPAAVRTDGNSAIEYLRGEADRVQSVGDIERTILALAGAGLNPRKFGGADLVARLRRHLDDDGSVQGQVNLTAFYALAMRSAGADPSSLKRPARWLRRTQNADGGWGINAPAPSESDSTGAALQALVAAGARSRATSDGAKWLRIAQREGGGWALGGSGVVNSQSTAWAIQGLAAAGGGSREIGRGLAYLRRLQAPDGHYRYSASSDQTPIWVTAQVLLAIERQPFPVPTVAAPQHDRSGSGDSSSSSGSEAGSQNEGSTSSSSSSQPSGGGTTTAGSSSGGSGSGSGDSTGGTGGNGGNRGSADGGAGETAVGEDQIDVELPDPDAATGDPAAAPPPDAAETGAPAVSVAYGDAGDDDSSTPLIVALAALGVIVGGGMLWYRRRGG